MKFSKNLWVVTVLCFGLFGCHTIKASPTPMVFDSATMKIVGLCHGEGAEYTDAYYNALRFNNNADGILNPQVQVRDIELPLGLSLLFPKSTNEVSVSGTCFKFKEGVVSKQ